MDANANEQLQLLMNMITELKTDIDAAKLVDKAAEITAGRSIEELKGMKKALTSTKSMIRSAIAQENSADSEPAPPAVPAAPARPAAPATSTVTTRSNDTSDSTRRRTVTKYIKVSLTSAFRPSDGGITLTLDLARKATRIIAKLTGEPLKAFEEVEKAVRDQYCDQLSIVGLNKSNYKRFKQDAVKAGGEKYDEVKMRNELHNSSKIVLWFTLLQVDELEHALPTLKEGRVAILHDAIRALQVG